MFIMLAVCKTINVKADAVSAGGSLLYLLFSRPLYILGFTLYFLPYLLKNEMLKIFLSFMRHRYFVPYARLTYGVFLCNTIFMQYRIFNLENGMWAQVFDTNLFFVAYLAASFGFSFVTYVLIEAPMANILNDFWRSKLSKDGGKAQHYRSQSAKAHLRDKSKKGDSAKGKKKMALNIQDETIDESADGDKLEDHSSSSMFDDEKTESLI